MRPLSHLFASSSVSMASSSSSSPSRRLAHITGHLLNFSSSGKTVPAAAAAGRLGPDAGGAAAAAVLVCLFEDPRGGLRVILTKRASSLASHSGEVALPGGKTEKGDADAKATALREAEEEIGLDPALVSIVAVLEPFLSRHLLNVVPVIGILSDKDAFKPVLNKAEVEDIFDAPLEMFLKNVNRKSEEWTWLGGNILVHYFDYHAEDKKFVIWGLTANILIRAASVVYQRQPDFVVRPRLTSSHIPHTNESKP